MFLVDAHSALCIIVYTQYLHQGAVLFAWIFARQSLFNLHLFYHLLISGSLEFACATSRVSADLHQATEKEYLDVSHFLSPIFCLATVIL